MAGIGGLKLNFFTGLDLPLKLALLASFIPVLTMNIVDACFLVYLIYGSFFMLFFLSVFTIHI